MLSISHAGLFRFFVVDHKVCCCLYTQHDVHVFGYMCGVFGVQHWLCAYTCGGGYHLLSGHDQGEMWLSYEHCIHTDSQVYLFLVEDGLLAVCSWFIPTQIISFFGHVLQHLVSSGEFGPVSVFHIDVHICMSAQQKIFY